MASHLLGQLCEVLAGKRNQEPEVGQGFPRAPVQHQLSKHRAFTGSDSPIEDHVDPLTPGPGLRGLKELLQSHRGAERLLGVEGGAEQPFVLLRPPFQDEGLHLHALGAEVASKLSLLAGKVTEPLEKLLPVQLHRVFSGDKTRMGLKKKSL